MCQIYYIPRAAVLAKPTCITLLGVCRCRDDLSIASRPLFDALNPGCGAPLRGEVRQYNKECHRLWEQRWMWRAAAQWSPAIKKNAMDQFPRSNGSSKKNFDPAWRGYNLCILSSTCRIRLLSTRCICLAEAIWAQLARSLSHQPLLSQWHWQPMLCFAEFDAVIEPRAAGNKKQPGITNYCKRSRAYIHNHYGFTYIASTQYS